MLAVKTAAAFCCTLALAAGCKQVKDTADQTKPEVAIKVRASDGQYVPATEATFHFHSGSALDLMCLVSDPGGVSRAALSYSTTVDACLTGSTTNSGVTIYLTGLPPPMVQTLSGNSEGKVLASVPLLAQLAGPLGCYGYSGGYKFEGEPQGQTLTVTCTGENWAANPAKKSATAKLEIDLQQ
jgi:hypothetical protein